MPRSKTTASKKPPSGTAKPREQVMIPLPGSSLSSQNESLLALAMRSIREELARAQKGQCDGAITMSFHVQGGQLTGTGRLRPDFTFRL